MPWPSFVCYCQGMISMQPHQNPQGTSADVQLPAETTYFQSQTGNPLVFSAACTCWHLVGTSIQLRPTPWPSFHCLPAGGYFGKYLSMRLSGSGRDLVHVHGCRNEVLELIQLYHDARVFQASKLHCKGPIAGLFHWLSCNFQSIDAFLLHLFTDRRTPLLLFGGKGLTSMALLSSTDILIDHGFLSFAYISAYTSHEYWSSAWLLVLLQYLICWYWPASVDGEEALMGCWPWEVHMGSIFCNKYSPIPLEFWCFDLFWPLEWLPPVHNSFKIQRWQLKHGGTTPHLDSSFLFYENFQWHSCKYHISEEYVLWMHLKIPWPPPALVLAWEMFLLSDIARNGQFSTKQLGSNINMSTIPETPVGVSWSVGPYFLLMISGLETQQPNQLTSAIHLILYNVDHYVPVTGVLLLLFFVVILKPEFQEANKAEGSYTPAAILEHLVIKFADHASKTSGISRDVVKTTFKLQFYILMIEDP